MRQGDGSDLLGPGDPRNSDIGILYVESRDSRQDILTAISTQELQGRKQIAIVLPEQGKAFRQPVDFDGLKNMRRQLKAQLIFIAPSGPGPAEFARQRRFAVYSSLDTFKTALLNEDIPSTNPRVKAQPNPAKRSGILDFGRKGRANKEKESAASQDLPPVPPTPRLPHPTPLVMPPTPPTPFMSEPAGGSAVPPTPRLPGQQVPPTPLTSEQAGPPAMPPMSPTPRVLNQQPGAVPPTPRIEDQKTVEANQPDVTPREQRESGGNVAGAAAAGLAAGAAAGMFAAGGLENDDDALYAPPAPPRGGAPAPIAQGSATPTGPASGPTRPNGEPPAKQPVDNRGAPGIIAFPSATASTPKATGKNKAAPGGRGSGKLTANQDTSAANTAAPLARGTNQPGTNQPAANVPGANAPGANPPGAGPRDKNSGNTGRVAAVGVGAAAFGAAAMAGNAGSGSPTSMHAAPGAQGSGQPPVKVADPAAPGFAAAGATGSTPVVRAGGGAAPGGPGMGKRPSGLTPLPPPYSRRQRRIRQRTAMLVVLLLLLAALVTAGIFAQRGALHVPGLPGSLSATVTITPDSKLETDNYVLAALPTGTPDPAQLQIAGRLLTQTSGTSTATANATGSISARTANGPLKFLNGNGNAITITSTIFHGKSGVPVSFNGSVTIPAGGTNTINGFAVNAGSAGNIPAFDISGPCCTSGVSAVNPSAFGGGQDAQPNSVIQQGDIDKAAAPLVTTLTQSTGAALQKQIKNSERVVDNTFQCKPTITSSDKAGATAKTTTVQVTETCTEEVYDQAQAQQIATSRLQTKAQNDATLGSQYALDGQIVTNVLSDTVVSGGGQVTIEVQARGLWVYQFTNQMQQNIKLSLVRLSQAGAQSVLTHDRGVAAAKINISGGTSMPANANDITLVIQQLPGAQATPSGTPGGSTTPGSPTVLPSGTGIPAQPTTTPVPGLGGS